MARDPRHRDAKSSHRFTDREVALLLQRAAEIEAQRGDALAGQGMSLRQLREIAYDVGISAEVFDEAIASVQAGAKPASRSFLGAPLTHKAARGVDGRLDQQGMERLIQVLEEAMDETGTVSEALGMVRWTSIVSDQRFDPTTQVSLAGKGDETRIAIVRRHPDVMPIFLHVMPTLFGAAIGTIICTGALHIHSPIIAIFAAVGAMFGGTIGHQIWCAISERSARKVQEVADTLAAAAGDLVDDSRIPNHDLNAGPSAADSRRD
jgi:hypothetical protein